MLDLSDVVEPPDQVWVSLTSALTWIAYRHSKSLSELIGSGVDPLKDRRKIGLEEAWRELADAASVGAVAVRGRRNSDRREVQIEADDLRNCRYLTWALGPDASDADQLVERVERYPDTFEGSWDRVEDRSGDDFYALWVRRSDLMVRYPAPSKPERRLRASGAKQRQAADWLAERFKILPTRSVPKAALLTELSSRFDLSQRRADEVWNKVSPEFPAWRRAGRPRKIPHTEINS